MLNYMMHPEEAVRQRAGVCAASSSLRSLPSRMPTVTTDEAFKKTQLLNLGKEEAFKVRNLLSPSTPPPPVSVVSHSPIQHFSERQTSALSTVREDATSKTVSFDVSEKANVKPDMTSHLQTIQEEYGAHQSVHHQQQSNKILTASTEAVAFSDVCQTHDMFTSPPTVRQNDINDVDCVRPVPQRASAQSSPPISIPPRDHNVYDVDCDVCDDDVECKLFHVGSPD